MRIETVDELAGVLTHSDLASLEVEGEGWSLSLERDMLPRPLLAPPALSAVRATSAPPAPAEDEIINAPMVGVFHEASPRIVGGQGVHAGDTLGTIDSLTFGNDIKAPFEAEITVIHVEDGQPVEYGQALFSLRQKREA